VLNCILYLYIITIETQRGMSHLKITNTSQGYIHKYVNLNSLFKKDQPEEGSVTSRNMLLRDLFENIF
jgi:hypothetical protein